jgi:UDP-N-acetylmuramoylalanine--D-glutamate ligase
VRAVVVIGEASDEIADAFEGHSEIVRGGMDMRAAVDAARRHARPGDVVLLSPACASFDMFDNYEHRGEVFKEIVRGIAAATKAEEVPG